MNRLLKTLLVSVVAVCSAVGAYANVPPIAYGLRNECLVSHEDTKRTKAGLLAGYLISRGDAEGAETGIHAGVLNRETHERHEKGAGFTYDKAGNLLAATNADATVSFVCDNMNRITSVTSSVYSVYSVYSVVQYSHDKNGNRTGLTLPGNNTVTYTYDDANRLSTLNLSAFSISAFSFSFDAAGNPTNITYPNGVTAAYTYDEGGRLTGLTYSKGGTAFINRAYTYNAIGQITKRSISAGLEAVPSDTHQHLRHNAADQLTHVSRMDNYEQPERWRDVGPDYDANGAVTNITVAYNGLTLENAFTWDYEGRLTAYSGEHQTNLWFVAPPIPESLSFKYDALGGRVSRTAAVGGAKVHVLDQAAPLKNVLVQRAANGTIERYYIYAPGFGLVAHIDANGTARYYHGDHLGSTIALTDSSGNVTDQFAYTPYGELMARTGTTDTPYTFCGRHGVYWEGGALYHMKARYYRADLARFISMDPLGIAGGVNLYAYANGDPMRFLDALGLCATRYDTRTDAIQQTGELFQQQNGSVFNFFAGFALDVLQRGVDTALEAEQSGFSPETSMTLGAIQGVGESAFAGATVQLGGMGAGQALGSIPALIPAAGAGSGALEPVLQRGEGVLIAITPNGQVITGNLGTSHAMFGQAAGVVVNGQVVSGAYVGTAFNSAGQIAVLNSMTFYGNQAAASSSIQGTVRAAVGAR